MQAKPLFIATPISAFTTDEEFITFRKWITKLTKKIESSGSFSEVFCVACIVESQLSLDDPVDSLVSDIAELDRAGHFLFIYPLATPTSALIELGYALAKHKTITIVHPKNVLLPFMATKLHVIYDNIDRVLLNEFDDKAITEVLRVLKID